MVNWLAHVRFNYLFPFRNRNPIFLCCFLYTTEGDMSQNYSIILRLLLWVNVDCIGEFHSFLMKLLNYCIKLWYKKHIYCSYSLFSLTTVPGVELGIILNENIWWVLKVITICETMFKKISPKWLHFWRLKPRRIDEPFILHI